MPEMLMCYEPGDRFATMAADGHARVWQIDNDGLVQPGFMLEPKDTRPHSRACGIHQHDHGPDCSPDCPTCMGGSIK